MTYDEWKTESPEDRAKREEHWHKRRKIGRRWREFEAEEQAEMSRTSAICKNCGAAIWKVKNGWTHNFSSNCNLPQPQERDLE
jgi:hypothetical protein